MDHQLEDRARAMIRASRFIAYSPHFKERQQDRNIKRVLTKNAILGSKFVEIQTEDDIITKIKIQIHTSRGIETYPIRFQTRLDKSVNPFIGMVIESVWYQGRE